MSGVEKEEQTMTSGPEFLTHLSPSPNQAKVDTTEGGITEEVT